MGHVILGLKWARQIDRPASIPASRPRGAKALGVRYERKLAQALPAAKHGLWWEYCDASRKGYCQTDLVLIGRDRVLVIECKNTETEEAWEQLYGLYLPVVQGALGVPALGVQVCKNLRGQVKDVCWTLGEALEMASAGRRPVLHWRGDTPLVTHGAHYGARNARPIAPNDEAGAA